MNTTQNQIKINGMVLAIEIAMEKNSYNIKKSFSYSKDLLKSVKADKNLVPNLHQSKDCDVIFIHLIPIMELNCIAIFLNFHRCPILLSNFQSCTIIRLVSFAIVHKLLFEPCSRNNNQMYFVIWLFSERDLHNISIACRAINLYSFSVLVKDAFSINLNHKND